MRYNFRKQFGDEWFGVEDAHSFDEAIKAVEKGIHDRELQFPKKPLPPPAENSVKIPFEAVNVPGTTAVNTNIPVTNTNETGGNKTT